MSFTFLWPRLSSSCIASFCDFIGGVCESSSTLTPNSDSTSPTYSPIVTNTPIVSTPTAFLHFHGPASPTCTPPAFPMMYTAHRWVTTANKHPIPLFAYTFARLCTPPALPIPIYSPSPFSSPSSTSPMQFPHLILLLIRLLTNNTVITTTTQRKNAIGDL